MQAFLKKKGKKDPRCKIQDARSKMQTGKTRETRKTKNTIILPGGGPGPDPAKKQNSQPPAFLEFPVFPASPAKNHLL